VHQVSDWGSGADQNGPLARQLPDPARWEGSRPRPAAAGLFAKPSVFVDRVIGIRLYGWHVFAAREDARPPGQGPANVRAFRLTPMGPCRTAGPF